jgi:hypothetical protein
MEKDVKTKNNRIGYILVALGSFFLLKNYGLFSMIDLGTTWPFILILIGLFILIKNKQQ